MNVEDEDSFESSNKYWICGGLFTEVDNKVTDHDHVTGRYKSSGHGECNITFKLTKKIPVIFHKLRGYDSCLIIKELVKFVLKINIIPDRSEKYMPLQVIEIWFLLSVIIDSMQFMNSSLQSCAKYIGNLLGFTENLDLKYRLMLVFSYFQQDNYKIEFLAKRLGTTL